VTLSKVSIAKLVWIGPIPLQISCDFLLQFALSGKRTANANSRRKQIASILARSFSLYSIPYRSSLAWLAWQTLRLPAPYS
jgi:hypothetical protein